MFCRLFLAAGAACLTLGGPAAQAAETAALDEVIVSATVLREQQLLDVPASVTALTAQTLKDSGQQHFQDVLAQVPNLNWAAGTSRPRYFQIRGIGEREQYEGAPNSSVGFLIDDIDFSGIGMAATLFDIEQIEVLRGPQGTRYGANALAGLIAVRSAAPSKEFAAYVTGDVGNYDMRAVGGAISAPIDVLNSAFRLSIKQYRSDGFRENAFLHRDDTNNRDELTARGKWRWDIAANSRVDFTFLHANLANGYDAFSIDNSRVTLSDKPGEDSQRANAGAIKWNYEFDGGSALTVIGTALDSFGVNSFDSDWGNPQSWAPFSDYDYTDRAEREHDTRSLEARWASAPAEANGDLAWLIGVYGLRLQEALLQTSNYGDPLTSSYEATNSAVFAQLEGRFADRWVWSAGLRGERRDADYRDSRPTDTDRSDNMTGGQASLTYELADKSRLYGSISRGYKAGGFNLGAAHELRPEFEPEFLWNYELGYKTAAFEGRVHFETSLFYMQRKDMQVRSGEQLDPNNPGSYEFVTSNVAHGENYGLESSLRWLIDGHFELGATLGLLHTSESGTIGDDGLPVPTREQAHAPSYQAQLNLTYRVAGWMARVDFAAVDEFYFDVPLDHDQHSEPYQLVNLKFGYEAAAWQVYVWSRNVFDEGYATRGFYFDNDPAVDMEKLYIQNGDPREFGLSAEWHF